MVSLYYLYILVDIADIRYNWLLWVVVVIVLFIWLPFCYVIVHRNICRNPSFLATKFLCHRRQKLDTLFSLYVSDSIVSFILTRIESIDSTTTTTTTTIRQSHHRSMSGLLNRIILFFSLIITALLLIHCSSRFLRSFLYGRYSRDQQPRGHLHSSTCYITTIFSLIAFDVITVTITCCEAQVDKILHIVITLY